MVRIGDCDRDKDCIEEQLLTNIQKFRQITRVILILGDLIYIPLIYFGSYWIRSVTSLYFFEEKMPFDRIHLVNHRLLLLVALHVILMYFHGFYDRQYLHTKNRIFSRTLQVVTLELLLLVAVYFFSKDIEFPRSIFVLLWMFNTTATASWHIFWFKHTRSQLPQRRVLIVGANDASRELLREIERLPTYGLKVVGVLTEDETTLEESEFHGYPILGNRECLLDVVQETSADEVVISSAGTWQEKLIDQIAKTKHAPARICIIPTCYEILIGRINHMRLYDIPLIEVIKHPRLPAGKRIGDFFIASVLLVASLPIFLIAVIAVKFSSEGPVFYKQKRIGKDQKPFTMFKFRTMRKGAEVATGPVLSNEDDTRVTNIGRILRKYRIDELPQMINIMKGEMSFVGPRPERPHFVEQFINQISGYGERFKATPGLTGLAQVNGGYATTPENKLKYDLSYIYNQSLWLDVRILLETVKVILTGRINQ